MERITSRQNPLVARCRRLARARPADVALAEGPHLLGTALEAGATIEAALFSTKALASEEGQALIARCRERDVHAVELTESAMAAASPVRAPSGVVSLVRVAEAGPAEVAAPQPALVVVVVDVQDPGNLGAIIRSADAGGATGVVAAGAGADPWGWKALRGSMGSAFRLPIRRERRLADLVAGLRAAGLRLQATSPRAGCSLYDVDLMSPTALLVGGEGAGLDDPTLALADSTLRIPMRAGVESLNVAVTAALVVYEAARQRQGHVHALS